MPLRVVQGIESESTSRSVVSDSLQPHGLYSPWNSPGQYTGVGSLLQGIFPNQDWTQVFCIAGGFFTSLATREAFVEEKFIAKNKETQVQILISLLMSKSIDVTVLENGDNEIYLFRVILKSQWT